MDCIAYTPSPLTQTLDWGIISQADTFICLLITFLFVHPVPGAGVHSERRGKGFLPPPCCALSFTVGMWSQHEKHSLRHNPKLNLVSGVVRVNLTLKNVKMF